MKQNQYSITGLIIGLIAGAMMGVFMLNQFKESQRSSLLPYSIGGMAIIFAASGYKLGNKLGKDFDIETALGIDNIKENLIQSGRVWIMTTDWTDSHNKEYRLITGQNNDKILITFIDDTIIMNHEIKSGSKDNVMKAHQAARLIYFGQLKAGY